jgi:Tol biopolymer transport system component
VAFSWNGEKGDSSGIYVKLIGSSGQLRLTTDPARDEYPAWSPDGRPIAFLHTDPNGNKSIREVSALGGAGREVAQLGKDDASLGGWTPDGRWLLVSLREGDKPFGLFLVSVESGEKRRFTAPAKGFEAPDGFSGDYYSSLSPDGRTVAFVRMINGGTASGPIGDLYVLQLRADSSPEGKPRRLTFDNAIIHRPAWIGGGEIVFSFSKSGPGALWRMPVSGAEKPRRLSVGENSFSVAFSPRSNRLVYEQQIPADRNIWRLDLSSPDAQPTSWIASTRVDSDAQYSPDGKRITFRSDRSGTSEIWACDADSSNAVKLTTRGEAGSPQWSPDGSHIAFDSPVEGRWQIFVVSAQGGKAQQLTFDSRNTRPKWSHDGMWIYYASTRSGRNEVWKLPVRGGKAIQLTRNGGNNPVESEDGTAIYYHSPNSLMKAAVDGSGETRVVDGVFFGPMALTRDGIYYTTAGTDLHPDLRQVRFLSFSKGTSRQVLKSDKPPGSALGLSPDGRWLLYTQLDGQPGSDLMLVENFH